MSETDRLLAGSRLKTSWRRSVWIIPLLIGFGVLESVVVYYTQAFWPKSLLSILVWLGSRMAYVGITAALILLLSRATRPMRVPAWSPWAVVLLAFVVTLLIAQIAMEGFPNSGDEFGYNYLADTLLHGRVWNPPIPQQLHPIFDTYYVGDQGGKRASQYPPGWSAILALFKLLHAGQYANAMLGIASCAFLWFALRYVPVLSNVRIGVFALGVMAPFVLFNNASFYNHTLTALCLSAIIWLDLRPRSLWNYFFIGTAFSLLLTARYETFLIAGVLFMLDGVIRKRLGFVLPALVAGIGALPITALLLWYNWRITGNPLETTLAWASPEITFGLHSTGMDGPHSLARGLRHTVMWLMSWQDFASVLILPLFVLALWRRVITMAVRWFDLLLPAIVVFFVFYPDYGGFQYGPRYWYFGYVSLPVTIAAGLPSADGLWHFRSWRFDPVRVFLVQAASFLGFTAGFASYVHLQTEVRETPFRVAETAPPDSLVLMPDTTLPYVGWQIDQSPLTLFLSKDFTRNGPDGLVGPLLLGRDLGNAQQIVMVCQRSANRHVFRLIVSSPPPVGHLEPLCNK
jgi:hypothetical protein